MRTYHPGMSENVSRRYRPKASEVEAVRWTGENWAEISDFVYGRLVTDEEMNEDAFAEEAAVILMGGGPPTLSVISEGGEVECTPDLWLVRYEEDHYGVVSDEDFRARYEQVTA